jgi:hypothetical protein
MLAAAARGEADREVGPEQRKSMLALCRTSIAELELFAERTFPIQRAKRE